MHQISDLLYISDKKNTHINTYLTILFIEAMFIERILFGTLTNTVVFDFILGIMQ
jgi:hypothetical protein